MLGVLVAPQHVLENSNFLAFGSTINQAETLISMTIDTIKVQIPLTEIQHRAILDRVAIAGNDQWAKVNLGSGEMWLVRIRGLAEADQVSFHREIRWDVPPIYHPNETTLAVELSLPKLWYGDNVRLLYDSLKALLLLRDYLNQAFGLKTRRQLPSPLDWRISRVDLCYTWRFPDQQMAQHFLDSLKSQRFPYKQPTIRPHSITFTGGRHATYSAKFYLKLPEFLSHDAKAMRKAKVPESEINLRKNLATGLLRFEITLRRQWLQRQGINTVSDLIKPYQWVEFDADLVENCKPFFQPELTMTAILGYWLHTNKQSEQPTDIPLKDGDYFYAPPIECDVFGISYNHPGGGLTVYITENRPQTILQEMLEKMVGKDATLGLADKVASKLAQLYKPVTAANLTAFWLYVQKFGSEKAREVYGKDAYYYKKRQLKEAGVSLLEQKEGTIVLGKDFFSNFSMKVPSEHVGTICDDERNSVNVLNIIDRLNREIS
jgi:hypothetical protein